MIQIRALPGYRLRKSDNLVTNVGGVLGGVWKGGMVGASNLLCEVGMGGQSPPCVVVQARGRSLQRNGGGRITLRVRDIETWHPASVQTAAVGTAGSQTSQ